MILVARVPTVQYGLRLLVPQASYLLRQDTFKTFLGCYDSEALSYTWHYEKPGSQEFETEVRRAVEDMITRELPTIPAFEELWQLVHSMNNCAVPPLSLDHNNPVPAMSESWYCCAEPTEVQLNRL